MVDEPEQERVRAWLAENGIQAITPPSCVESCRRELIQAGAWQSATDPIHANKSVAEAPWFSNEFKEYGRGQRRAFACMFLDDCKPGVELLDKNWNAQQPKGNSLFYEVFDSGWSSDDDGTSNSAMRMLYKAVTADPEAIDDRTIATILNTSGFKHGPVQDALRKITDPSLWKVEDHGYYREVKCDYLAWPRNCAPSGNLRIPIRGRCGPTGPSDRRETVRTLQFMEPEDVQTVGRSGRHGGPGTVEGQARHVDARPSGRTGRHGPAQEPAKATRTARTVDASPTHP